MSNLLLNRLKAIVLTLGIIISFSIPYRYEGLLATFILSNAIQTYQLKFNKIDNSIGHNWNIAVLTAGTVAFFAILGMSLWG
ncbi:MAG TPA: hypothetical protein VGF79_06840 [Bacteroidia bacterium]